MSQIAKQDLPSTIDQVPGEGFHPSRQLSPVDPERFSIGRIQDSAVVEKRSFVHILNLFAELFSCVVGRVTAA
jgi:hypothetical protein